MKDLHTENYKSLMTKFKNKQMNGKVSHVHWLEDSIVKMYILSKAIYRVNAVTTETLMAFFF